MDLLVSNVLRSSVETTYILLKQLGGLKQITSTRFNNTQYIKDISPYIRHICGALSIMKNLKIIKNFNIPLREIEASPTFFRNSILMPYNYRLNEKYSHQQLLQCSMLISEK